MYSQKEGTEKKIPNNRRATFSGSKRREEITMTHLRLVRAGVNENRDAKRRRSRGALHTHDSIEEIFTALFESVNTEYTPTSQCRRRFLLHLKSYTNICTRITVYMGIRRLNKNKRGKKRETRVEQKNIFTGW